MKHPAFHRRALATALSLALAAASGSHASAESYFRLQLGKDGLPLGPGSPGAGTNDGGSGNTGGSGGTGGTGNTGGGTGGNGGGQVDPSPMQVSGPSNATMRQNRAASMAAPRATGGSGAYTWSVAQGPLPAGLALGQDGTVSGTPTVPGAYPVSLAAADGQGRTQSTPVFTITVIALPTLAYAPPKLPFKQSSTVAPKTTDVIGPATYASTGAALPGSMALDPATGRISGDPGPAGITGGLQVSLTDSDGATASSTPFSIEVNATQSLVFGQDGTARTGVPYSLTFQTQGLAAPIAYTLAGNAWPAGLDLDQSGGRLAGTPTAAGTYPGLAVKAKDANNVEATSPSFTVTVTAPKLSNPGTLTAALNKSFSYDLTAQNLLPGATWVWSGSTPPGLSLVGSTIQGVPSQPGTYSGLQATAVDSGGSATTGAFTIVVQPDSLQVLASPAKVRQGSVATIAPTISPAGTKATWAVEGTQPDGMSFDPTTGVLSGVPTKSGGGFDIIATAGNLVGRSDPLSVTVYPQLTASAQPVGAMASQPVDQALTATGVIGTATWKILSGVLPDGLALRPDGHLVGTPSTPGSVSGVIARVTDSGDGSMADTQPFSVTVAASNRMLVTGLSGVYGTRVNRRLALPAPTVQNAQGTPTFSVTGALPPGITVDPATGIVQGTATAPGNGEPLQVTASDTRPSTASSPTFAVRLLDQLSVTGTADLTVQAGTNMATSVTANNLMGQGQFALLPASTQLPAGLRFEDATGRIVGRPTTAGTFPGLTVQLTDPVDGSTATSQPFTLTVTPALVLDGPTFLAARVGQPFTSAGSFVVRNATGPLTWRLSAGTLPSGLSLDVNTGAITGTPTQQIRQAGLVLHVDQADGLIGETQPFAIEASGAMGITVGTLQQARANISYAITPTVTNNVGAVTWNIAQGSPPPGMNFDPSTGRIYGVTSATGTYGGLRLHAKDSIGQEATTDPITFQIGDQMRIAYQYNVPDQRFGTPIPPVKPFAVTGAVGAYTITANYPTGMLFSADGTLSGTFGSSGCCPYVTATVTDSTGATASAGYGFGGKPPTPYLSGRDASWVHSSSTSYTGTTKTLYSFYTASGPGVEGLWDSGKRHFELVDPTQMQPWMSFSSSSGDIYGTPTDPGTFKVDVVVVDDVDGVRSAKHTYVMTIVDGGTIVNGGAYHIRTRVGKSFSKFPIDVNNGKYTQRPAGWCKASFQSSMPSGVWMNLGGDCSVWNYPWDVPNPGTWNGLWIEATDDNGVTTHVDFDVQIAPPLTVKTAAMACTRTAGATITQGAESVANLMGNATYVLTPYFSNDPATLPQGMTFNPANGTVSGVPANYFRAGNQPGDPYKLTVTDDWDGSSDWAMIGMEYRRPLGNWNNGSRSIQYKRYDSFNVNGDGLDPSNPRTWTVVSGSPPPGIAFTWDNWNAYLKGSATQIGAFDMTARIVTDCPAGTTADVPFHWDVAPALTPNPPTSVTMREGVYSRTTPAPSVEYGQQPITWSLPCCNGLPQGISVDPGTGQLVGTPAKGTAGTYQTALQPSDKNGYITSSNYTLVILPAPGLTYSSVSSKVGSQISQQPQASNVQGPSTYASTGTAIPADLGIAVDPASGSLSGRPAYPVQLNNLQVTVTDSSGLSAASNAFSVAVAPGPTATMATPQQATVGTAFSAVPSATNVTGATTWALASGTLPRGLSVDPATGTVKGTPGLPGTADNLVLSVTDASGAVAQTNPFSIAVAPGQIAPGAMGLYCITAYSNGPLPGGAVKYGQMWFSGPGSNVDTKGALPSCQINVWGPDVNSGLYQNWTGLAQLYDGPGRGVNTLGSTYDWVVVTDVATGQQFPSSANIGWILSNFVSGSGSYSRTFTATGQVSGTGELRSTGQFNLTGTYGSAPDPTPVDPYDPTFVANWFWGQQQCITTCNRYGICDARQYQTCVGKACTQPSRTCYQVYNQNGGIPTSQPVGQAAANCVYPQYGSQQTYCP